ncbi:MAG: replicative DNA helicase, partial [Candidatus Zixiibacteriota bacterium]
MATRTHNSNTRNDVNHLQPPQSIAAEQDVLGAVLKDQEAIHQVVEILTSASHFYAPKHQMIYSAILELYEKSEPCDITTVSEVLRAHNQLEKTGGRVYLVELVEAVVSTANVEHHARIVLEKSILRRLIQTSNEIVHSCYAGTMEVDDLLDQAEVNIFDISESRLRTGFVQVKELLPATYEQIENFQSAEGGLVGLKTGYTDLDTMTHGLHPGDLVIVAGRPSMGKTSFAMNIAENIATAPRGPKGVGIFSIEMSKEQLALRMLCSRSKVSQHKLRSGKLRDEEWGKLTRFGSVLSEAPIFIDDSPSLSALEVRAKARRLKAQHDIGLIVVDYIQLMHAGGRLENRQQEIALISRGLKAMAKELSLPVIAISQLSRQVEQRGGEKRPQLSDLRESGAIEP